MKEGKITGTHVGVIGGKVAATVQLVHRFKQTSYKFCYYGSTTYTYIMKDEAGNVYVWKTSSILEIPNVAEDRLEFVNNGDILSISGTVKEHTEYKGEAQTVLTRCKYSLVKRAADPVLTKRQEQKASLAEGDVLWQMPYRQYKEHYADCETLAGSFNKEEGTIGVIIRKGRLKNSGVRGKHYSGYQFRNEKDQIICYRAICLENALKRAEKDYPNHEWSFDRFYAY